MVLNQPTKQTMLSPSSLRRLAKGFSSSKGFSHKRDPKGTILPIDAAIKDRLKAFWTNRKKKKKEFYVHVVKFGLNLAVLALVLQYANFAVQSIAGIPLSSPTFLVLQFGGIVVRVFGVCCYSTVPCSEFDFVCESLINGNKLFRRFVFITLGLICVIGGIAVGKSLGNTLLYLLDVPVGLGFFYFAFTASYESSDDYVNKIRATLTYRRFTFLFQFVLVVLGLAPGYFSLYNYYLQNNIFILLEAISYLTSALVIFILAVVGNAFRSNDTTSTTPQKNDDRIDSFMKPFQSGANDLNIAIYICQLSTGMGYMMYGSAALQDGAGAFEVAMNYLTGIGDFIPLVVLLYFGPQRCFWSVAYLFEHDSSIKLDDGAFMAELVSTCSKFDTAGDNLSMTWCCLHILFTYPLDHPHFSYALLTLLFFLSFFCFSERVRWVQRKKPEEDNHIRPTRLLPPLGKLFDKYEELRDQKASEINRIVFVKATLLTIPDIRNDKKIKMKIDFHSGSPN